MPKSVTIVHLSTSFWNGAFHSKNLQIASKLLTINTGLQIPQTSENVWKVL